MSRRRDRLLTEVELELMTILWELKGGTAREVLKGLPEGRELAYTSVSTMLRILVEKGFAEASKEGRSHRYSPLLSKRDYEGRDLRALMSRLFGGDPLRLVRRLVKDDQLSRGDLEALRQMVDEELPDSPMASEGDGSPVETFSDEDSPPAKTSLEGEGAQ